MIEGILLYRCSGTLNSIFVCVQTFWKALKEFYFTLEMKLNALRLLEWHDILLGERKSYLFV